MNIDDPDAPTAFLVKRLSWLDPDEHNRHVEVAVIDGGDRKQTVGGGWEYSGKPTDITEQVLDRARILFDEGGIQATDCPWPKYKEEPEPSTQDGSKNAPKRTEKRRKSSIQIKPKESKYVQPD